MIENGYWQPGHLECPCRDKFNTLGQCFAVSEYYKKNELINPSGVPTTLFASYALKTCALKDWNSSLYSNTNYLYRLGQEAQEVLILDYYYYDFNEAVVKLHPRKLVLAYEDGVVQAVPVKALSLITDASGSADRFMQMVKKLSRNYAGTVTWE